jgi:hypothetical protein
MEPQSLLRPQPEAGDVAKLTIKELKRKYFEYEDVVCKVAVGRFENELPLTFRDCWFAMQCYLQASRIGDILKSKQGRKVSKLKRLKEKISIIAESEFPEIEDPQNQSADVNLDYCKDIRQKILLLFGIESVVTPVHFPGYDDNFLNSIEARKINFNKIDQSFINDFEQLAFSLIYPPEAFREDLSESPVLNHLILQNKNIPVSNITICLSLDGKHCRIRIGTLLIVSNSDYMSPAYAQTICRIDNEVIEDIIRENDPTSGSSKIPVLRGYRDMGFKVARYLGLT